MTMKKVFTFLVLVSLCTSATAQSIFAEKISVPEGFVPEEVVMPPSPLDIQVLFVGGTDIVQATATYGNPAGPAIAKEWHDFIGFTPDETGESLGWVSVNHEQIYRDDRLGDGGGMTVFRVNRNEDGTLEILDQTLEDGRSGKFFNVDFVNTVGETGMNCGGISSMVDGRIWTAEEWFRSSNASINSSSAGSTSYPLNIGQSSANQGVRDTADWTISSDIEGWDGKVIKKYENFNWMVEIDPRQAKAIRKQYNWGRQPFEGGAVNAGNNRVYLGPDDTPGFFSYFLADEPGDFTKGTMYVYKHDKPGYKWVPIWDQDDMLDYKSAAVEAGATMYNRIEWVAIDPNSNYVYFTETGRDNPGSRWEGENEDGAVHDPYHMQRAQELGLESPNSSEYPDYYGRIWQYDPFKDTLTVFLEGGPFLEDSPIESEYPEIHLSNPDGLNFIVIDGRSYMVIMEDLNGRSFGRVPAGVNNSTCELFLLDMTLEAPKVSDLIRLSVIPKGAEVTGAMPTADGKSLLVNVQHPSVDNPFPFNHSLTFAINGFDQLTVEDLSERITLPETEIVETDAFTMYPNPTTRTVFFNKTTDIAVYDASGQRVMVRRNISQLDVSQLAQGIYFLRNAEGKTLKLSVK